MFYLFILFLYLQKTNIEIHFAIYLFPKLQNILFYDHLHNYDSKKILLYNNFMTIFQQ